MKGCQNLTHIFTISASWFHDTLLPCKSWRDPGDSGFMPHDWRTKVKIYWICSLASKWWLRVFSGFPRVWMTGCRGVKSRAADLMLHAAVTSTWASRDTLDTGQSLQECRPWRWSIHIGRRGIYQDLYTVSPPFTTWSKSYHTPATPQDRNSNTPLGTDIMTRCESVTFLQFRGWALMVLKALKSLSMSNYWQ